MYLKILVILIYYFATCILMNSKNATSLSGKLNKDMVRNLGSLSLYFGSIHNFSVN